MREGYRDKKQSWKYVLNALITRRKSLRGMKEKEEKYYKKFCELP